MLHRLRLRGLCVQGLSRRPASQLLPGRSASPTEPNNSEPLNSTILGRLVYRSPIWPLAVTRCLLTMLAISILNPHCQNHWSKRLPPQITETSVSPSTPLPFKLLPETQLRLN